MITVVSESGMLEIPEEFLSKVGIHPGARVECTATSDGFLIRPLIDRAAIERSLRGAGRRLMPNSGSLVEALLAEREEDARLEFAEEMA